MSANRIEITVYIGGDEVGYNCQSFKHYEGINQLYHSIIVIEKYFDSLIDWSVLDRVLQAIKDKQAVTARVEVDNLSLKKQMTIYGNLYASGRKSTSGSGFDVITLYLSHESFPLSLSCYSGVLYQARVKDVVEQRLIRHCQEQGYADYTHLVDEVDYQLNANRYPTHPALVQYQQSTQQFLNRVLGAHGLWYHLYCHQAGVDYVVGDSNAVFTSYSQQLKADSKKAFYYDDQVEIYAHQSPLPEAVYQSQILSNGFHIEPFTLTAEQLSESSIPVQVNRLQAITPIYQQSLQQALANRQYQLSQSQQQVRQLQQQLCHHQKSLKDHQHQTKQEADRKAQRKAEDRFNVTATESKRLQQRIRHSQQQLKAQQQHCQHHQQAIDKLQQQLKLCQQAATEQSNDPKRLHSQYISPLGCEFIQLYHTNDDTPGQLLYSQASLRQYESTDPKPKLFAYQNQAIRGQDYFVNVTQAQLDEVAKTQAQQIIFNNAAKLSANFQGYFLRAGTFIKAKLNREDHFRKATKRWLQSHPEYLVTEVLYEYTAEKDQAGQLKKDGRGKVTHYQEKHSVLATDPKCDYRPMVNDKQLKGHGTTITGVKAYQASQGSFEIVPDAAGYLPICYPFDYQVNVGANCRYTPRALTANALNSNHSFPIYPDTELLIECVENNPEHPLVLGAVANGATGHINSSDRSQRNVTALAQGQMLAYTLNEGDNNSLLLKTTHHFEESALGKDQSYVLINNIPSLQEAGKKHLDLLEATTANKTIQVGGRYEKQIGVGANGKANYHLVIDPAISELEPQAVKAKRVPPVVKQKTYLPIPPAPDKATLISYSDFLNRPETDLGFQVLDNDNQTIWQGIFRHAGHLAVNIDLIKQQPVQVQVQHKDSHHLHQQLDDGLQHLQTTLNQIISKTKAKAKAMQQAYDQQPWYQKVGNEIELTDEGLASGVASFFKAAWQMSKQVAINAISYQLQPIQTLKDNVIQNKKDLSKAYAILSWLRHNPQVWNVLVEFAENYLEIYQDYPIYADQAGSKAIGGLVPLIILAIITKNTDLFGEALVSEVTTASTESINIAKIDEALSQEATATGQTASGRIEVYSQAPKDISNLTKAKAIPIPESLAEVGNALKISRENLEQLNTAGYQHPFTDDELLDLAKKPFSSRFLVSLQTGEKADSETLPFIRDSGRAPMWATSLDMLLKADTDPKLICDILGLSYDKDKTYYLYIMDAEKLAAADLMPNIFPPNFENMKQLGEKEFIPEGATSESLNHIMTPEYQKEYAQHIDNFASGDNYNNRFNEDAIEKYSNNIDKSLTPHFINRHKYLTEIGANEYFEGNGVTKYVNSPLNKYGAVEYLAFARQENTPTINQLKAIGALESFPMKPIERK